MWNNVEWNAFEGVAALKKEEDFGLCEELVRFGDKLFAGGYHGLFEV
jgi:hypothetical protein